MNKPNKYSFLDGDLIVDKNILYDYKLISKLF